jgi:hypothetical protein
MELPRLQGIETGSGQIVRRGRQNIPDQPESSMAQTDTIDTASYAGNTGGTAGASTPRTLVPQFALDVADAKIATWSTAIVDAADTIERLVASESLPVPDGVRDLATATTKKLRSFGTQSGDYDAAELVSGLQRTAAAHPAASIGLGAAIGATLAALLVRFGSFSTTPDAASPAPKKPKPMSNGSSKDIGATKPGSKTSADTPASGGKSNA